MTTSKSILLGAILNLTVTGLLHASIVTWDPPTTITGDSDVSNAGTLVNAVNFYSTSTPVNGTAFTLATPTGGTFSSGDFTFNTSLDLGTVSAFSGPNGTGDMNGSPLNTFSLPYQEVLGTFFQSRGTTTLTMSGLVSGGVYQFQFWSQDAGNFSTVETATAGNSVSLSSDTTSLPGGLGQFAIGTFTADGSQVQSVSFSGTFNMNTSIVDALQLRLLSSPSVGAAVVPEASPTLGALLLLGVCGFEALRSLARRKRAAGQLAS